jgi:hypothetical protein
MTLPHYNMPPLTPHKPTDLDAYLFLVRNSTPMTNAEQDAADDAQRIQWARLDAAASKAATDAHFPDFDEHAAGMCDPRHSLSRFHDGVVVIPAALINQQK